MSKTVIRWIPYYCNVCGLPLYERASTTGGVCKGHPNIEDELDDILKQFDIDAIADYWKALSDKRLELLKESVELFYTLYNHYVVNEEATLEMIGKIEEELADA